MLDLLDANEPAEGGIGLEIADVMSVPLIFFEELAPQIAPRHREVGAEILQEPIEHFFRGGKATETRKFFEQDLIVFLLREVEQRSQKAILLVQGLFFAGGDAAFPKQKLQGRPRMTVQSHFLYFQYRLMRDSRFSVLTLPFLSTEPVWKFSLKLLSRPQFGHLQSNWTSSFLSVPL